MRVVLCGPGTSAIRQQLDQAGFAVSMVGDAAALLSRGNHDLVVLHCPPGAPECSQGIRALREADPDIPVLVLCAEPRHGAAAALGHGAFDVVGSDCGAQDLVARCQALIRRSRGFDRRCLTVGPLTLDLDAREAWVSGRTLQLTGREFAILQCLALRNRMLVTRDSIVADLCAPEGDEPEGRVVDIIICRIRRKLAASGAGHLITTVWGAGYRMDDQRAA